MYILGNFANSGRRRAHPNKKIVEFTGRRVANRPGIRKKIFLQKMLKMVRWVCGGHGCGVKKISPQGVGRAEFSISAHSGGSGALRRAVLSFRKLGSVILHFILSLPYLGVAGCYFRRNSALLVPVCLCGGRGAASKRRLSFSGCKSAPSFEKIFSRKCSNAPMSVRRSRIRR